MYLTEHRIRSIINSRGPLLTWFERRVRLRDPWNKRQISQELNWRDLQNEESDLPGDMDVLQESCLEMTLGRWDSRLLRGSLLLGATERNQGRFFSLQGEACSKHLLARKPVTRLTSSPGNHLGQGQTVCT